MNNETFSAESFWPAFEQDLSKAQVRVIIQSPFIASRRVMKLQLHLARMLERNVRLCFFLQAPNKFKSFPEWYRSLNAHEQREADDVMNTINWLESQGVHINVRSKIHEKLAIIDKSILWEGSLNILSHRDTNERMRRICSVTEVLSVIQQQKFDECDSCAKFIDAANESLAETLAKARERKNISQRGLAQASGVNQSTISRVELEEDGVGIGAVKKIADALGYRIMAVPEWMALSVISIQAKTLDDDAN